LLARPVFARALFERAERGAMATFEERLTFLFARPATVGSRSAYAVIAACEGVETASPLLDPRVAALVVAAPPELRTSRDGGKAMLLRLAMRDRLPRSILDQHKRVALNETMERRALSAPGAAARVREAIAASNVLAGSIDMPVVDRALRLFESGAPMDARVIGQLAALFDFATWSARIEREYGVAPPRDW
jgi:hypothetical protein